MPIDLTDYNAALDRYRHLFPPEHSNMLCRKAHFDSLGEKAPESEKRLIRALCALPDGADTLRRALLTVLYRPDNSRRHDPAHVARLYFAASCNEPLAALKLGVSHNNSHHVFHQDLIAARMFLSIAGEYGTADIREIALREITVSYGDYGNLRAGSNHRGPFRLSYQRLESYTGESQNIPIHLPADTLVVPPMIRQISAWAFSHPSPLKKTPKLVKAGIRHVILPESVRMIDRSAFKNCTTLESIYLPHNLHHIDDYAFQNCTSLKTIVLPPSLFHIGFGAFENCRALESVVIPGSVSSVGNSAFQGAGIRHLRLEAGVRRLEPLAFSECPIETFEATDSLTNIHITAFSDDREKLLRRTSAKVWAIPESDAPEEEQEILRLLLKELPELEAKLRTALLEEAYRICPGLIRFGARLGCSRAALILGQGQAAGLYGLAKAPGAAKKQLSTAAKDAALAEEADRALQLLKATESFTPFHKGWSLRDGILVIHNGVTRVSEKQFRKNTQIRQVLLPQSLKVIEKKAFAGCTNLEAVFLPDTLTEIQAEAFRNCSALTSLSLPNTLRILGRQAFQDCIRLKSVSIPGSVDTVEKQCFENCLNLKELVLGHGIRALEKYAFSGCPLEEIDYTTSLRVLDKTSLPCQQLKRFCRYYDTLPSLYGNFTSVEELTVPWHAKCIHDSDGNHFYTFSPEPENELIFTAEGLPPRTKDFGYHAELPDWDTSCLPII